MVNESAWFSSKADSLIILSVRSSAPLPCGNGFIIYTYTPSIGFGRGNRRAGTLPRRTGLGRWHRRRCVDDEVTADDGDMKKATQWVAVFHWPRLSAESTG